MMRRDPAYEARLASMTPAELDEEYRRLWRELARAASAVKMALLAMDKR